MNQWYVVHTHPLAENLAATHLLRQGFEPYLPYYLKRVRHARRVQTKRAALFPRYIFILMDVTAVRWRAIQSTVGVSHLICSGNSPTPVPDEVIQEIRSREDDKGLVRLATPFALRKGTPVRIESGPFADCTALFEQMSDKERVVLLLQIMGRPTKIRVPISAINPHI